MTKTWIESSAASTCKQGTHKGVKRRKLSGVQPLVGGGHEDQQ